MVRRELVEGPYGTIRDLSGYTASVDQGYPPGVRVPESVELGIAFDVVVGATGDGVRRVVEAVPALVGRAFRECELAMDRRDSALLACVRLEGPASVECVARLRFWCARVRGSVTVLGAAPSVSALWRSRFESCTPTFRCVCQNDLVRALVAIDGGTAECAEPYQAPVLDIDVGGPGSNGMAFNSKERLLFVPGHLVPPVGDEFEVVLRARGAAPPARCRARVAHVRPTASATPGTPAGYLLQLGAAPAGLVAELSVRCASMNADAMVEEARRAAPRYSVRAAVDVELLDGRSERASASVTRRESESVHAVSLSIGGAFLETTVRHATGTRLLLRFRDVDQEFETTASVVFVSATGMGVKFDLEPRAELVLGRLLARVSARPRRALVVDDDALTRWMLTDALAELGYDVLGASSGEGAVRILARELYAVDALITDVHMDGVDGSQLLDAVHSAREHVAMATIAVTGRLDAEARERLVAAGADAVLDKAIGADTIAGAVDAIVDRLHPAPKCAALSGKEPSVPTTALHARSRE